MRGQIVGLIGPNGAGKTTVFNLISGFIEPDEGDVQFEGANLLGLRPHEVCMRGLTRTFQLVKPFAGLSVLENAMVGALRLQHNPRQARESAEEYLDLLGLAALKDRKAAALTVANRKRLEIARALATEPKALLLDEPLGGLNSAEVDDMVAQLRRIRDSGITILLIEHVMKAVMSISDHIVVIHHGEKIAEGTPEAVSTDPEVVAAYLGVQDDAA